jgi:Effector Associated Constant Component 1
VVGKLTQLRLKIDRKPEDDDEQIEQMVVHLLRELNELNVDKVDIIREKPPPNSRGDGVILELLVTLLASGGVATSLINFLQSWSKRYEGRTIKVTTHDGMWKLSGYSPKEAKQLLNSMTTIGQKNEHK